MKRRAPQNNRDEAESPSRRRVLHLIHAPERGGTERRALELIRHLDRGRFDVRWAAVWKRGALAAEYAALGGYCGEYPIRGLFGSSAIRQAARLANTLRQERIHILHAHDLYSGWLAVWAARLQNTYCIADRSNIRPSHRRIDHLIQRVTARLAHRVIANSSAVAATLRREGVPARKISLVQNGVAPTIGAIRRAQAAAELKRELGLAESAVVVGMVAHLRPVKGHRLFLEAAAALQRQRPDVYFVLVGEGDQRPLIEADIGQLGLADRVCMLGDRQDGPALSAAFDVAVLSSWHEGLPNAVLEAMASGTPVVATAAGGVVDLIEDGVTGQLVPVGDSGELARRILRVIEDPGEAAVLATNARDRVKRLTFAGAAQATSKLYDAGPPKKRS